MRGRSCRRAGPVQHRGFLLGGGSSLGDEPASVRNLDDYLEALYDDLKQKVKATAKLAQLSRRVEHLEDLINHESNSNYHYFV